MPFSCGILQEALRQKVEQKDWELYLAILPWMKQAKSFKAWREEMSNSNVNNKQTPEQIRDKVKEVRKRLG